MEKSVESRQSLIDEGLRAIILNGYDGVGLSAILSAAKVPKGSFYYFFRSKEEFVVAVLDAYEQRYKQLRATIFADTSLSPLQRLGAYFGALEHIHLSEDPLGGCLYGVLAQTVSTRGSHFRDKLAAVFSTWNACLQSLLTEAQTAGEIDPRLDTKEAAAFLIEAYEGALIRMKVDGGPAAFNRFKRFALGALSRTPAL